MRHEPTRRAVEVATALFYGIKADRVGLYILPFALGNFLGPVLLGPLFDRVSHGLRER